MRMTDECSIRREARHVTFVRTFWVSSLSCDSSACLIYCLLSKSLSGTFCYLPVFMTSKHSRMMTNDSLSMIYSEPFLSLLTPLNHFGSFIGWRMMPTSTKTIAGITRAIHHPHHKRHFVIMTTISIGSFLVSALCRETSQGTQSEETVFYSPSQGVYNQSPFQRRSHKRESTNQCETPINVAFTQSNTPSSLV